MCPQLDVSDSIGRLLNGVNFPIACNGSDVITCLQNFVTENPAVKPYIFDEKGALTPFVNIYLNGKDIRFLDKLSTDPSDKIEIIPSLSGG